MASKRRQRAGLVIDEAQRRTEAVAGGSDQPNYKALLSDDPALYTLEDLAQRLDVADADTLQGLADRRAAALEVNVFGRQGIKDFREEYANDPTAWVRSLRARTAVAHG